MDDEYFHEMNAIDIKYKGQRDKINICLRHYVEYDQLMNNFLVAHIFAFVACLFREAYSTRIKLFGFMIKVSEILGICLYFSAIFQAFFEFTTYFILDTDF